MGRSTWLSIILCWFHKSKLFNGRVLAINIRSEHTTVSIKATKGNVNDTTRRRSALSIVIVVAVAPLKLFTYSLRGINYCSFLLHNFHFPNLSPSAFNIVVLFCYPAASPLVFTGRWVKVNRTAWMLPLACHQHTQPPDVTCNSHLTTK